MAQNAQPAVKPPVTRSSNANTDGHRNAPIWPNDSTPPVTAPARPAGARRADSDSRIPCQDIAVALSATVTAPIPTAGQSAPDAASATTLTAIPNASPAMTGRGLTWKLPSQPPPARHPDPPPRHDRPRPHVETAQPAPEDATGDGDGDDGGEQRPRPHEVVTQCCQICHEIRDEHRLDAIEGEARERETTQ